MSLVWSVGDHEALYNSYLDKFTEILSNFIATYPQNYWYIHVNSLFCKCGNKLFNFNLGQNHLQ